MSTTLDYYKELYGNVFLMEVGGKEFVFRPLTRKEYRQLTERRYENTYESEEAICATATLHPENYDFAESGMAGIVGPLCERIIQVSGRATPEQSAEMLDYYRYTMNEFDAQAETVIALVFPGTTPEEMQDWTQEKLVSRLARAEWVMKTIWNMPFEFGAKAEESEGPEEEPPTLREMGEEVREHGGDPMFELSHLIKTKAERNYMKFPFIGGVDLYKNEEVLENVRKQIQGLPEG